MKRLFPVLVAVVTACFVATPDLFARGGGGGGRGGGGGGARGGGGFSGGGGGMSRAPSMSRPAPRPAARPATPNVSRPSASRPSPPKVSNPIAGTRPGTGVGTAPRPGTGVGTAPRPGTGVGSVPRPGTGVATRPSNSQLQNFLDIKPGGPSQLPASRPGNLGGAVAGGAIGGAAADFLRDGGARPSQLPANRPGTGVGDRPAVGDRPGVGNRPGVENPIAGNRPGVGDRPGVGNRPGIENPISGRPDRIDNRQERHDNRVDRRDEIRDQVRDNHPRLDFWGDHPNWAAWRINRPYRWATWAAITGWVGYGWSDPYGYAYGENVYYDEGQVYYGDQPVATAEEYAQQAEDIATSAPETSPEQQEWMPLGVFALTPDGQKSGPDPTLFLQLAISKQGIIAGLLNNTTTGVTQEIEGMADKGCQRVAWTVKGKSRPIMETGISNLTEDTAPVLVHFADGQTQQWLMVRLEEPATAGAPAPLPPPPAPAKKK